MSNELKDCPFCGGEAHDPVQSGGGDERNGYNFAVSIQCKSCGVKIVAESHQGGGGWCDDTGQAMESAISAWNSRTLATTVASAAPSGEREAFEAWFSENIYSNPAYLNRRHDDANTYVADTTESRWIGWQARAAIDTQKSSKNATLVEALKRIEANQIEVFDEDLGENVLVCMDAEEMVEVARAALATIPVLEEPK